jgi:hypothetical protein
MQLVQGAVCDSHEYIMAVMQKAMCGYGANTVLYSSNLGAGGRNNV